MSQAEKEAISVLTAVIGKKYVLTDKKSVEFYSMDYLYFLLLSDFGSSSQ